MRPVLVGLAITDESEAGMTLLPLSPNKTGSRLARLMGISNDHFVRRFARVNICPFPVQMPLMPHECRFEILNLMGVLDGRRCVLLGQNVASCFGLAPRNYKYMDWHLGEYNQTVYTLNRDMPLPFDWAVIPHPPVPRVGGARLWYNNPNNAAEVGEFLRDT